MRINDPNLSAANSASLQKTKAVEADGEVQKRRSARGGATGSDQIQLSQLAESLSVEQPESPQRQARLEQLALSVERGEYKPDLEEIAKALVKEATASGS